MWNSKIFVVGIFIFISLVFIPLFSFWWLFFALGFLVVFFFDRIVASVLAAIFLDGFYFGDGGNLPMLTIFIFVILIIRSGLRDRLRF